MAFTAIMIPEITHTKMSLSLGSDLINIPMLIEMKVLHAGLCKTLHAGGLCQMQHAGLYKTLHDGLCKMLHAGLCKTLHAGLCKMLHAGLSNKVIMSPVIQCRS